jgi:hypothetical protein
MVRAAVGSNGDSNHRHSLVANILGLEHIIYTAHDGLRSITGHRDIL